MGLMRHVHIWGVPLRHMSLGSTPRSHDSKSEPFLTPRVNHVNTIDESTITSYNLTISSIEQAYTQSNSTGTSTKH